MTHVVWPSNATGTRTVGRSAGVVAAVVLLATAPAAAHHSFVVEYDPARPVTVHGVVTRVEWTNPHARILVNATDSRGVSTTWSVQLASPNVLERRGWRAGTLRVGSRVRFDGYRGVAVATRVVASRLVVEDGRVLLPVEEVGLQGAVRSDVVP
jgi:hypothetical protein